MHDAPSEKVMIPQNKSFILLEGEGWQQTSIEWADHAGGDSSTAASPTFAAYSADFMARDITFKVRTSSGPTPFWLSEQAFVCFLFLQCNGVAGVRRRRRTRTTGPGISRRRWRRWWRATGHPSTGAAS